jgi:hypothetical protein
MQVKLDSNLDPVRRSATAQHRSPKVASSPATVRFDQSAGLDRALAGMPDMRPDAVERARKLIADPNYPSKETLWRVGELLASGFANVPASA